MTVGGGASSSTPRETLRPGVVFWSALTLVAVAIASLADGRGATQPRVTPPVCRIDLSTAPVEELALLPEVGPQLAARIVADRAIRGAFASVDDLARVAGIGERTIAELRACARATQP